MSAVATVLLLLVLALAVRADTLDHRIPNELVIAGAVAGLLLAIVNAGFVGAMHAIAGLLVGGAMLLPFYLLRGLGAGDVKLMAVVGAYLGPSDAVLAAAISLVAGAALGICVVLLRLWPEGYAVRAMTQATNTSTDSRRQRYAAVSQEKFPYAVAIATGAGAMVWLRGGLSALLAMVGLN
ncbi:MAG: hypothetical protein RL261_1117 [Pseudomonadota bacterium]|jgi:prepilin peptidase CpaA